jgi:hypothetical protein
MAIRNIVSQGLKVLDFKKKTKNYWQWNWILVEEGKTELGG